MNENMKIWKIWFLRIYKSLKHQNLALTPFDCFFFKVFVFVENIILRAPHISCHIISCFFWNSLITYSSLQPKALWVGLPGAKKGHLHGRTEKMCPWSYQDIWRRVFVTIKIVTETNKSAQSPSLFQDSWAFSRAFTIGIAASSITFWRAEHKAEKQGQLDQKQTCC